MKNCIICFSPCSAELYLVLKGRIDQGETNFIAEDDAGVICTACYNNLEDSANREKDPPEPSITVGNFTIVER